MGVVKLSTAGILDYQKYSSALAGNTPYSPFSSAYELLETEILTGSQASVTFSSLNSTYGANYQHLQLRMTLRGTSSSSIRTELKLNSASSTYASHELAGNGSSVASSANTGDAFIRTGRVIGGTGTANSYSAQVVDILDAFETTKATTVRTLGGSTGYNYVYLTSGLWTTLDAVDSIQISPESGVGSWEQYCRFSLYGRRAA